MRLWASGADRKGALGGSSEPARGTLGVPAHGGRQGWHTPDSVSTGVRPLT